MGALFEEKKEEKVDKMKIYLVANTAGAFENMNKLEAIKRLYSFYEIINKVYFAHKDFEKTIRLNEGEEE